MHPTAFRVIFRWLHIVLALAVGTYLYSPWAANPTFAGLIKFVLFPLAGIAGVAMWQQARLLRLFAGRHVPHAGRD
jgi:hypothetical protein